MANLGKRLIPLTSEQYEISVGSQAARLPARVLGSIPVEERVICSIPLRTVRTHGAQFVSELHLRGYGPATLPLERRLEEPDPQA